MSVLIRGMEKPENCGYCRFRYDGICHALQKTQYSVTECPLVSVPTPQGPERKKGRWVPGREISREILTDGTIAVVYEDYKCSSCGLTLFRLLHNSDGSPFYKFCPNCGADMRGEQNVNVR